MKNPAFPPSRPPRCVSLPDFAGNVLSLPDTPEAWSCRGQGADVLLLGLGPGDPRALPCLEGASAVFWLESGRIRAALAEHRKDVFCPPASWQEVSPQRAVELAAVCRCCMYRPGLRLDPDFWGPLLGRMDAERIAPVPQGGRVRPRAVLLPGSERQLLHQELRSALRACGFARVLEDLPRPPEGAGGQDEAFVAGWQKILAENRPELLLSVNLRGIDAEGRIFGLCRALGVPVALWFVDNPWHVLSGVRLPWWREACLFVTDAAFLPGLREQGATRVFHLPLAVAPHMWGGGSADSSRLFAFTKTPLFVGRSAFPGRERFFAAARVPQDIADQARHVLHASRGPSGGPHFFWWRDRLNLSLWPGARIRQAGLGAEDCSRDNRLRWLLASGVGQEGGVRLLGDMGWRSMLPGVEILPPVDYYGSLPQVYARAAAVLNVTSLLLPHSLSQRHFDVWACGGLLLSDATPGLEIFPHDLTEPICLNGPEDFLPRLAWLESRPEQARQLRMAWREHLRSAHEYTHRVQTLCAALGL